MFTREYFDDHERKFRIAIKIGDNFARKAMFYSKLYKLTGLKWAKDKSLYYVNEGTKLLVGCMGVALADIAILDKIIKEGA